MLVADWSRKMWMLTNDGSYVLTLPELISGLTSRPTLPFRFYTMLLTFLGSQLIRWSLRDNISDAISEVEVTQGHTWKGFLAPRTQYLPAPYVPGVPSTATGTHDFSTMRLTRRQ